MAKRIFLIMTMFGLGWNNIQSQVYVGSKGFGQLKIINDSVLNLSFYGWPSFGIYVPDEQLCYYTVSHDTMYVSTCNSAPLSITYQKTSDDYLNCGEPVIVYCFQKTYTGEYVFYDRGAYLYDTATHEIHIRKKHWTPQEELYVVHWGWYSCRGAVCPDSSNTAVGDYDIIIANQPRLPIEVSMARFPLLKKGNKIIPLSPEENENFWIVNGFYFPTFYANSKSCPYYHVLPLRVRGTNGLYIDINDRKRKSKRLSLNSVYGF